MLRRRNTAMRGSGRRRGRGAGRRWRQREDVRGIDTGISTDAVITTEYRKRTGVADATFVQAGSKTEVTGPSESAIVVGGSSR
jgi:hypothetical protein